VHLYKVHIPVVDFVDVWSVGGAREEREKLFPGEMLLTARFNAQ